MPLKLQYTVMSYSILNKIDSSSIVKMESKKMHRQEANMSEVAGSKACYCTGPADRVTESKHVLG
jgi:hypothetical protein